MSDNQAIQPASGHINLSASAFRKWADHYYQCRHSFRYTDEFSPVPYFLLCRAIELQLKAFHLEQHIQKEVKDMFGHNLVTSYKALPLAMQILSGTEFALLEKANTIYSAKGFEYINVGDAVRGFSTFPDLVSLDALAKKLLAMAPSNSIARETDR